MFRRPKFSSNLSYILTIRVPILLQSGARLKFTKRISRQKIILIFNIYNAINLKEKISNIKRLVMDIENTR